MPNVTGLLETSLYVENVQRSVEFYQTIFGFPLLLNEERIAAFRVKDGEVLLLFKIGGAGNRPSSSGGKIPPPDGNGVAHLALAIAASELDGGASRLGGHQPPTGSRVE